MDVSKRLENTRSYQPPEGDRMIFDYEFENERLKMLTEKKAKELNISVDRLIWNYVNRGLMEDNTDEDLFKEVHSEEYLNEIKQALGIE